MTTRPEPAQRGGWGTHRPSTPTYPISLFLFIFPRWPWIGDSSPTTPMTCLESRGVGRTHDIATTHHHHIITIVIPPHVWCLVFPVLVPAVRLFYRLYISRPVATTTAKVRYLSNLRPPLDQ